MSNPDSTAEIPVLAVKRRPEFQDLTGQVFGRLTVIQEGTKTASSGVRWVCSCSCGGEALVRRADLKAGKTVSCGCRNKEAKKSTHGMRNSTEYSAWKLMWGRCTNPNNDSFAAYKDKTPPDSWEKFENFFADMGPKPSTQHTLDREDSLLPYGPANCRWATPKEQARNRSNNLLVSLSGAVMPFVQACEIAGLTVSAAYSAYRRRGMLHASNGKFDLVKEKE